ncbi:MAG TPA: FecR domain-containing protein, partial [Reyranella sp.]|nr:FecR domain-containing protein [Reyranella sp.]
MESQPDPARSRASREASEWSVLLQDDPDDADLRRRFEAWRTASALHAEAWIATERAAGLAAEALPAYAHEWHAVRHKPDVVTPLLRARPRWLAAGASLALAAAIAWIATPVILLRLQADHVTGTAEMRRVPLGDGSEVTLAPGSAIAVSLQPGERRVELLKGEAFFAVAPDPKRPFRIMARSVEASVLGTSFDVRLDESNVVIAVEEGIVGVSSLDGRRILQAGQSVRIDGRGAHEAESPDMVSAWRRGQLYVQNQQLADAVETVRRYFPGTIVIADRDLAARPTTGVFNLGDPEAALR